MVRVPRPKPCFLDECKNLGFVHGEMRWRSSDGEYLYTWDGFHGEIEVFNKRGKHLDVLDAVTGRPNGKGAMRGRRINV
ncbi:colicin E3/pyocin S6 family cytotoxin [Nitrospirillum amazonense]|uniref:colicin E3/pyocin S6 family cytotoxin n=1 Tax=Nitrospirillum amazonense TaxID=28077 RepID=UPI00164741DE